jgi:transcriptional regulator with XRE-family HTH domain
MFDKKRCISNIYFLAKDQGKKIGDIENKAGVSAGYISRINKDDNNTNPGIEFLTSVADELGVSLDALISDEFEALSPTQTYLVNFLERLIKLTQSHEIKWNRESERELDRVSMDEEGEPDHPLYALAWGADEPEYCSRFFTGADFSQCDDRYIPVGDGYNFSVGDDASVYLMKVRRDLYDPEIEFDVEPFYELYLVQGKKVEPLCCSTRPVGAPYATLLPKLYQNVADSYGKVDINQNAKDIIDAFMSRTESKPFLDIDEQDIDELPFD